MKIFPFFNISFFNEETPSKKKKLLSNSSNKLKKSTYKYSNNSECDLDPGEPIIYGSTTLAVKSKIMSGSEKKE